MSDSLQPNSIKNWFFAQLSPPSFYRLHRESETNVQNSVDILL